MDVIKYKKTIVGWYNFTDILFKYNVDPIIFRSITGVGEQSRLGTCEVTMEELALLKESAINLGLADGWEVVPSDEYASEIS